MKILHPVLGLALAVLVVVPARAADWGNLYGYVDWTTDYRFIGASESNRHATVQGGLHWAAPENFYAGVFVSGIDFLDYRKTSYEVDVYAGRHFHFDGNDLNVELLYADYPDTEGHPSYAPPGTIYPTYNFFEAMAELKHKFGAFELGAKIMVEPKPDSHGGMQEAASASASYAITDWLTASAQVGHQWMARGPGGTFGDVGLTATWHLQWVFDLRYYATDISTADCYGQNWCKPAVVAKITYQFQVL